MAGARSWILWGAGGTATGRGRGTGPAAALAHGNGLCPAPAAPNIPVAPPEPGASPAALRAPHHAQAVRILGHCCGAGCRNQGAHVASFFQH